MLVETFPRPAQLRAWGLATHGAIPTKTRAAVRAKIVAHLEVTQGVMIDAASRREMLRSADALDAVLATFGARAAANRQLKFQKPPNWKIEGAIAIHA